MRHVLSQLCSSNRVVLLEGKVGCQVSFRIADHTLRIALRDNLAPTDIDGQIELQYLACR